MDKELTMKMILWKERRKKRLGEWILITGDQHRLEMKDTFLQLRISFWKTVERQLRSLIAVKEEFLYLLIICLNLSTPLIPLTTSNIWEKVDGDVLGKGSVPMSLNYPIIVISGTRDHSHWSGTQLRTSYFYICFQFLVYITWNVCPRVFYVHQM